MDAVATESVTEKPQRSRWFSVTPAVEFAVLAIVIGMGVMTYLVIRASAVHNPPTQPPDALLMLANLVPCVALIVLIGRRIAKHRAARSQVAGGGRLHVRLVATFSLVASVPIILTVIAASLMFQAGVEFWVSNRAQHAFTSTMEMVDQGQNQILSRWLGEARQLVSDMTRDYPVVPKNNDKAFQNYFNQETYYRNLEQSVLFDALPDGRFHVLYVFSPPTDAEFAQRVTPKMLEIARREGRPFINRTPDTLWVLTKIPNQKDMFLYVGTSVNADFVNQQHLAANSVLTEYGDLQKRNRSLQLTFNIILFAVALLIIAVTVFIALKVADRLVRPIDQLVGAARRVTGGELSARVPSPKVEDEIGTLGIAFNTMTERLQVQTTALVTANAEVESRRALIEAVMSGVTAGVISIDSARSVRLINSSAMAMLARDETAVGQPLSAIAPELDTLLDSAAREAVVQVTVGTEARTLAVKVTRDEAGQVLTFDDITQQLLDQRRAAWSDVARRIAHEIKNPLTPIQLAAERLQRRYGKTIDAADTTFARLTDTIVRQVGDLRRIVDEFSSFARMPKPLFREESLLDIGRQAMFLHEVAHPAIRFEVDAPDNPIVLVSDRRQIGQALTNVVKNAVEAIEARGANDGDSEALLQGEVVMTLRQDEGRVVLTVADNGIGLPVERDRIVEPYMTTRARGTGLGLAIVKKIIEEHCGTISFGDRPGGGTIVTICFDSELLANMLGEADADAGAAEPRRPALTRTGNTKS